MKRLLIVVSLLLIACGGGITAGTVVDKTYEPERTWVQFLPIQTGNICSGSGTTRSCVPIIQHFPFFHVDDEDWILHLEECTTDFDSGKRSCKTGRVYVGEEVYQRTEIGDYFDGEGSSDDPVEKHQKEEEN